MTKLTTPVEYPGFDYFKNNLSTYIEAFLRGEVIAFKNANCTQSQQEEIMKLLGDALGWWPNSIDYEDPMYYETHHQNMNDLTRSNADSIMLQWHLEHVGKVDEFYVGACWYMDLFKCSPSAGKTLFVDVIEVYESLPLDDQAFLATTEVQLIPKDPNGKIEKHPFCQKHWISGKNVVRPVFNQSHDTELFSVNGAEPTSEDREKFKELFDYIVFEVTENKDIRLEHSWSEGDMLILDVFRLAHAVTGGFKENERKLDGIFGILRPGH